LRPAPKENRFS